MRFHVVRVDEESARLVEEALEAVKSVSSLLGRFEESVISGSLEEELERLSTILERLLLHGVSIVETALERARLLVSYAHALRVRLSNIPRGEQRYLMREYNDFVRHVTYIRDVLTQVNSILSTASRTSGSRGEGYGRSRARPAV